MSRSFYQLFFLFLIVFFRVAALAQWDVSGFQILGEGCQVDETTVDESKLTLKFSKFSAALSANGPHAINESICTASVRFKVPAQRQLSSLTHRVFAYAQKNEKAELALNVDLALDAYQFGFRGVLPAGPSFNDIVLLYKSFDTQEIFECATAPQYIDVNMTWKMAVKSVGSGAHAMLNLSGNDLWVDSWIETKDCSLLHSSAGADNRIR